MSVPSAVVQASVNIEATPELVRRWFLSLKEHPDRYKSGTHGGFTFTKGTFGEPGARFQTHERLGGVHVYLCFELTAVGETRFAFRLLRPPLPVWGAFQIEPIDEGKTRLFLLIGGESRWAKWILRLPLLHDAVRQQIEREVSHIESSVASLPPSAQE